MTLNLTIPAQQHTDFSPRITVIGVGGGGTNAVNNMIAMNLDGVDFVIANTDAQSLMHSRAERRVQLGPHLTQGLGAGAKPEIGRAAAEEATDELARHMDGVHMVFVTAGMGGGTGTGAAPVIARMARERGILTVGVVTKPFDFEGPKRKRSADQGIEELQQFVDTLIVIPNQNLFRLANERTTFAEAFKLADNVLYMGVRGVTDLMVNPGLVNLDFADIRTVMAEMGKAMMGTGEAEGDDRAVKASEAAISNPLLEDISMRGARGVLINITGGYDMTLFEVDEAANRIRKEVDEEANIIFGSSIDETMNGRIRVSVVATGIDVETKKEQAAQEERLRLVAVGGGAAQPARGPGGPAQGAAPTVAQGGAPAGQPGQGGIGHAGGTPPHASHHASHHAGHHAGPIGAPVLSAMPMGARRSVLGAPAVALPAEPVQAPVAQASEPVAPHLPAQAPIGAVDPAARPAPVASRPAPAARTGSSLFGLATGLIKRTLPETAHAAPAPAPAAPRTEPQAPAARPAVRPAQQEEAALDIPTFLRRQSNGG
ncbi:cell division protein FtsZ [Roseomonas sp. NAR14]|uniref:Cell division protein FtsZ n=1 Tax=Roseomonas acroporae TaxID=2937791 RepID=A0A9X1Y376_9PROT|nr:cell division protein FtsZ [Roseomonas acroporae]MCK8783099.1 cell division protein FtsZ [Roseomonas acroporae]